MPVRAGASLGLLPAGTGGDLKRTLELPSGLDAVIEVLATGTPLEIDLGAEPRGGGEGIALDVVDVKGEAGKGPRSPDVLVGLVAPAVDAPLPPPQAPMRSARTRARASRVLSMLVRVWCR